MHRCTNATSAKHPSHQSLSERGVAWFARFPIAPTTTLLIAALLVSGAFMLALMPRAGTGERMARAASAWLTALTPELRAKARFGVNDPWRTDWHFIPRQRKGVSLGEMNDTQRRAARDLLRSALSAAGYLKVENIIDLELVLRAMEQRAGQSGSGRDPEKYTLSVFVDEGKEPGDADWGWKFEGHHVSLNFASASRELTATAPMFFGANPAEVLAGPYAGLRVLSEEEDLGHELMLSFDEGRRARALITDKAPADIILSPGAASRFDKVEGLREPDMTEAQRAMLWRLIEVYAKNLTGELRDWQLDRIRRAGVENIAFAWAGGLERDQGHYYRIQGPTFVVEYDKTQDHANHTHTAWHDPEHDFGRDVLREHYLQGHDGK